MEPLSSKAPRNKASINMKIFSAFLCFCESYRGRSVNHTFADSYTHHIFLITNIFSRKCNSVFNDVAGTLLYLVDEDGLKARSTRKTQFGPTSYREH